MNAKPHRQNTKFQLRYFLAGSCTTPDGAYSLLYGQLNDMQTKLAHADAQLKKRQSKLKAAEAKEVQAQFELDQFITASPKHLVLQAEADLLEAQADRLEVEADIPTWEMNLKAAKQELKDIEDLMAELKPMCKYADLDILEQSEAAQEGEWLGELKMRAENFLLTQGTIPHDHFHTMRMHPQFKEVLIPFIQDMSDKVKSIGLVDYGSGTQGPKNWAEMMLSIEEPKLALLPAPQKEE